MSTISDENQVTIPERVLDAAGLRSGDEVRVSSLGPGRIGLVRASQATDLVRPAEIVDELAGRLGDETYPDGYLEREREGWG